MTHMKPFATLTEALQYVHEHAIGPCSVRYNSANVPLTIIPTKTDIYPLLPQHYTRPIWGVVASAPVDLLHFAGVSRKLVA